MIEIRNVSFARRGTAILEDVSITIPKGGISALIGPNGAGKSTLFALMSRLEPLDRGDILVDGNPIRTTPSRILATRLAILRQDPAITSRLRVAELVAFGRFPHGRGSLPPSDMSIISDALEQFGLSAFAGRFMDTLSGGERQRALVAMAYCQGTDYLLLDEPLNNLDMYHARQLMQTLRRLCDEQGKTVVIVLHDVNQAAAYADNIVALKNGKVAASGPPELVLIPAVLEAIFGFPMRVERLHGQAVILHHR